MLDLGEAGKVALFGGTYNNWLALEATVTHARAQGVDELVFLGDAGGFGPHPNRTVDRLRTLGIQSIQGNYDDSVGHGLADCQCGYTDPRDNEFAQISYDYTLANTSWEHRKWLAGLPTSGLIRMAGKRVRLCHGSPRRVNEFLWQSTTPDGFLRRLCDEDGVDVIACTHTGIHWECWLDDGRGIVNVGAIGRPPNNGRTEVFYSILEVVDGRLVNRFVPLVYEHERLAMEMDEEGLPREFSETIRTGWWTTCLEILPARERSRGQF